MKLNGFEVTIPQGTETSSGYINMKHNTKYTINLYNTREVDCDAFVVVDGKAQGGFRIPKHGRIVLERPVHDTGHFTCYKLGTPEGESAQLVAGDNLGLITVKFKLGRVVKKVSYVNRESFPLLKGGGGGQSRSAAGTGLSGTSSQTFDSIMPLDYDESLTTTLHLRLVVPNDDEEPQPHEEEPRPLTPAPQETVIPPSVLIGNTGFNF